MEVLLDFSGEQVVTTARKASGYGRNLYGINIVF